MPSVDCGEAGLRTYGFGEYGSLPRSCQGKSRREPKLDIEKGEVISFTPRIWYGERQPEFRNRENIMNIADRLTEEDWKLRSPGGIWGEAIAFASCFRRCAALESVCHFFDQVGGRDGD